MQDVAANRTCAVGIGQRSPRAPPRGKPPETCHIFLGQHNGLDTSLPPPITAFRCTRMVLAMMLLCASSVTLFNGPEPTCVYRSFPAALDPRCILLKSPCMMSLSAVCMHRISLEAFDALNAPQMARMLACLGYFAGAALSRWSRPRMQPITFASFQPPAGPRAPQVGRPPAMQENEVRMPKLCAMAIEATLMNSVLLVVHCVRSDAGTASRSFVPSSCRSLLAEMAAVLHSGTIFPANPPPP